MVNLKEAADDLEEVGKQILELLAQAAGMLEAADPQEALYADCYWLAHARAAIQGSPYSSSLFAACETLRNKAEQAEGEQAEEEAA